MTRTDTSKARNVRVRDYSEAIHPHSGRRLCQLHGRRRQDRIRDTHRHNYDRLAQLKRRYDPENLFHMHQNITAR